MDGLKCNVLGAFDESLGVMILIPWWGGLGLFFAGVVIGVFLIALTRADRGD